METTPSSTSETYKDFMVDIETSGLNPGRHAIIQLSCVPFDLKTQRVAPTFYDSYLMIPPWRSFSVDTLQFWLSKNRSVYEHICSKQGDIVAALTGFAQFVEQYKSAVRPNFWMRRAFDWMFVESYFNDFEIKCPFHYQNVIEMTSFLKGTALDDGMPVLKDFVYEGERHHAYWDCKNQISQVFGAINLQLEGSKNA